MSNLIKRYPKGGNSRLSERRSSYICNIEIKVLMEECIIEVIKIIPSLILTLFGIFLFLYYRKYLNILIKYLLDFFYKSKIKSIKIGDTSFEFEVNEFIYSKHKYNQDNLNEKLKVFNSYSIIKRSEFVIVNNVKIRALWIDDNKLEIMPLRILTLLGKE